MSALAEKQLEEKRSFEVESAGNSSREELTLLAKQNGISPLYLAKVECINAAFDEIGMGKYQWKLFMSTGFGYAADNIWLQAVAIVMPAVANESSWGYPYPQVRLATLALYAGLIVGASFWGITADIVGRKFAFNSTLLIGAIFGIALGGTQNFVAFCGCLSVIGFGCGGNLPIDGALMLEFLPTSHVWVLTFLSVWWAVGQVLASLIAWAFISKFSCDSALIGTVGYICDSSNNSGWRYTYYMLGGLLFVLSILRIFILKMDESPKFLISINRDAEAVAVIQKVARINGKISTFSLKDLEMAASHYEDDSIMNMDTTGKVSSWKLMKQSLSHMDFNHMKPLFATSRLAYSTSLVILIYAVLGLAYPLFNAFLGSFLFLKQSQLLGSVATVDQTYSAYTYQAASGVVGSIAAAFLVKTGKVDLKFTMAFFTIASGLFLFGLTASTNLVQVNVLTSMAACFENGMYGILYAFAPMIFPSTVRGTGDGLASSASRITGILAPVIAVYSSASQKPDSVVLLSAGLFILAGLLMLGLINPPKHAL